MNTLENFFHKLVKSELFLKIDLSKGYWQIPVADENMFKIAFVTSDGANKFFQMPFGIKNFGATLVCEMRKVLSGMSGVERYIDN